MPDRVKRKINGGTDVSNNVTGKARIPEPIMVAIERSVTMVRARNSRYSVGCLDTSEELLFMLKKVWG